MSFSLNCKASFSEIEEEVLQFWDENQIFQRSIQNRSNGNIFFFYDGPPFATGLPHYGHILAGTIKDVIPRYKTMQGYQVERKFGWDCHGLPVEFEAEKELKLNGKKDIDAYGIDRFNEYCRSIVLRYSNEWKKIVRRMGRWVDLENDYKTMDPDFMESIWYVFHELWQKNLIYFSFKIVAYSPRLHTPLSNFEVNLGYKTVKDPSITVKFQIRGSENRYFLSWTTTPWTLPSNLSLTVHPDIDYAEIAFEQNHYILAKAAIEQYFKPDSYHLVQTFSGKELEKTAYVPLYESSYTKPSADSSDLTDSLFTVTLGDYVEIGTGTGIVQTAPAFGEDDFKTGKKYNLPLLLPFNASGEFTDEFPDYAGLFFKDADKPIIENLKSRKLLFHKTTIEHSYPFCWRSGSPLMYRAIPSWYVRVESIKETLLKNNQSIHWMPTHIQSGRMGKWLESARDWAISRNRYWGTPIPVWICSNCQHHLCLTSRADLAEHVARSTGKVVVINDLHRHKIDHFLITCPKCNSTMQRTPEVLDCWFESGSMPYGQQHYPFENKEEFDKSYPADFISEGLDQTRGWFYTLLVLSTALFEKPAFQNCIVSGLILAEDGQKMSKSLKNYPDPEKMISKYGVDAVRLYMISSGAVKGEELRFSEQGLNQTLRDCMLPIWNVLNFLQTYSELHNKSLTDLAEQVKTLFHQNKKYTLLQSENWHPNDLWVLSKLESLKQTTIAALENYDLYNAVTPIFRFTNDLSNWYVRTSRKRFTQENWAPFQALYYCLKEISLLLAPFVPFFAEAIYQILKHPKEPDSVHLQDYPQFQGWMVNQSLEQQVVLAQTLIELGRTLRAKQKIRLRQPLQAAYVYSANPINIDPWLTATVISELNVKQLIQSKAGEGIFQRHLLPNLPVLGKKYGKKINAIKQALSEIKLTFDEITQLEKGETSVTLAVQGESIVLTAEELYIKHQEIAGVVAESKDSITLRLDCKLNDQLIEEGWLRDFLNKVQQERKSQKLQVHEKIALAIYASPDIKKALEKNVSKIEQETQTKQILWLTSKKIDWVDAGIDGQDCYFCITTNSFSTEGASSS